MTDADSHNTPSRRTAMFGTGAFLAGVIALDASARAVDARSDAELIAFAKEVEQHETAIYLNDRGLLSLTEEEIEGICARSNPLIDRVRAMRPTSPAGFCAKAQAVRAYIRNRLETMVDKSMEEQSNFHEILAFDLISEIADMLVGEARS